MNISSNISQVIYQTQLPGKILLKKAYIWPEYSAGKIERINPVNEKADTALNYIKRLPSPTDQINEIIKTADEHGYTSSGQLESLKTSYTPGSYFEALA